VKDWLEWAGRRFARLATRAVVARPGLWRFFRGPLRKQFDWLAPVWEARRGPEALLPLATALERLDTPPRRALDIGTGTGKAARLVARLFPETEVVGLDLSPGMIEEARRLLPEELAGRVGFEVADASSLPFADGSFDLVVLLNMIPFFDELARVTSPGGTVVFAFFSGAATPIYTPVETIRTRLAERGFGKFEEIAAGEGTAFLARMEGPG
jgi:SAM-dependent methyltransferase